MASIVALPWLACHSRPAAAAAAAMGSAAAAAGSHNNNISRKASSLLPVAVTSNLSGRFGASNGEWFYHALAARPSTNENRVIQVNCQKQDADISTLNIPRSNEISGARSFVGGLLERALSGFLKSQLDQCGDLCVAVGGSNWDLLAGNVRNVQVSATKVVYQGVVLTEVDLTVSKVRVKLGRRRLVQQPFHVNAHVRVQEQDFNSSLASPLVSGSFQKIFPKKPPMLLAQFDSGNLRFSTPDQRDVKYGHIEYPITLSVIVEKSGEVISVKSSGGGHLQESFTVGPEVKITHLQVDDSWLSLIGDFLVTPS